LIDFRYHVVSIIAVFLALTVGLVLGSSFVGDAAYGQLRHEVNNLNNAANADRANEGQLQGQLRFRDAVIDQIAPGLVADKLAGDNVAVIVLPGAADAAVSDTETVIKEAGANLDTQVTVHSAFTDPDQQAQLATLARQQRPGEITPIGTSTPELAATDIAAALTRGGVKPGSQTSTTAGTTTGKQQSTTTTTASTKTVAKPGATSSANATSKPGSATNITTTVLTQATASTMLNAFVNAGFVSVSHLPTAPADMSVVVSGQPSSSSGQADRDNTGYLALLRALQGDEHGTVLAGTAPAATSPGLIAASIADTWSSKNISTVDSADLTAGEIAIVYSLVDEESGTYGHYGMTGNTDGPLPKSVTPTNSSGSS
jgi:hypothetical protein